LSGNTKRCKLKKKKLYCFYDAEGIPLALIRAVKDDDAYEKYDKLVEEEYDLPTIASSIYILPDDDNGIVL